MFLVLFFVFLHKLVPGGDEMKKHWIVIGLLTLFLSGCGMGKLGGQATERAEVGRTCLLGTAAHNRSCAAAPAHHPALDAWQGTDRVGDPALGSVCRW